MTDETERPRLSAVEDDRNRDEVLQQRNRDRGVEPLQKQVGRHFAQEMEEELCYNHEKAIWLVWNEVIWEKDDTQYAFDRMLHFTTRIRIAQPRAANSLETVGFNEAALKVAAADRRMARATRHFDADSDLMGTPEGYVDLSTGILHPPDREKMISMQATVTPKEGDCPQWMEFLRQAQEGQEENIQWLQKLCGEALLGRQTAHHFAFFYGTGGNGKTQFISVLRNIMGEYAAEAQEGTFTRPDGKGGYRGHSQVLAVLEGKRLVIVTEPSEGEVWDLTRVKSWAGGNHITANLMRQNGEGFKPVGLLLMEGNHQLKVESVDNSVARRLRYLVWPHEFAGPGKEGTEIVELAQKLVEEEGPEIFAWMIRGAQMVIDEGLGFTDSIRKSGMEYLTEQDVDRRFLDECLEDEEGGQVDLMDVTDLYNEWAHLNDAPQRKRGVGTRMKSKGVVLRKNNARRFVDNLTLSVDGMTLMSQILARRIKNREMKKTEAGRWKDVLKSWKHDADDATYLNGLFENEQWMDD